MEKEVETVGREVSIREMIGVEISYAEMICNL